MTDPRRRPRWLSWLLEAVVILGVFATVSAWQTRNLVSDGVAPAFALKTLDGKLVRLEDLRGKSLLVHFWATWCGACRYETSALNSVHARLDGSEALLSVVADSEDVDQVRRVVAERGIRYPVLLATPDVLERYRVSAFPTNYFISPSGTIRSSTVGMSTRWSLAARMGCARR
jgi:peroxiredoxin